MSSEKSSQNNQRLSIYTLNNFNSTTILAENGSSGEYNPFEHRSKQHANSTMGSLAHILKCSLGTGILAIPMAFKNSGLLFGAIGTLIVGLICTHCVRILVKTSRGVCRRAKVPALDFAGTAEKVFETGPPFVRKYAYFAKAFCEYGMSATYLGVDCVLMVLIATSLGQVINNVLGIDWEVRIYIALTILPCIVIGEIRHLKYLVPFSAVANLCLVITFGITLYYMLTGPMPIEERPLFSSWAQLPLYFSTVIFAMEGIGAVMPVENSMEKPEYFMNVLNTAMFLVVILYILIGFLGYARFGDTIEASITMNLPKDELAAKLAQILIGVATLFTFGLQFYVPMDILWKKISPKISKDKHNISQILIRGGTIIVLGGISAAVPKLNPFIGLVGAIFFSSLGLLAPAVIETVFRYPNDFGVGNWILFKNIFLVMFSLLAITTGSFVSIKEIIEIYTKHEK